jgi:ubiquinone/menaquinone biosynthesis C-methylase UbiE
MSGASENASDNASDNIVGSFYDKYRSRNPIARALTQGFLDAVTELYSKVGPKTVLEVGCGEGQLAAHLWMNGPRPERFLATDLSTERIEAEPMPAGIEWEEASIYTLPYEDASFELVICCEVLEHLEDPEAGLREVTRVAERAVLLSTPWEPMWRALNVARLKYLRHLGNTPGHLQHFSRDQLRTLAERRLRITDMRTPLPWTVLLGEPRD